MRITIKYGYIMSNILYSTYKRAEAFSSKKVMAYVFSLVVIYLAIWTDKQYYDLLIFITALMGLRVYQHTKKNPEPPGDGG